MSYTTPRDAAPNDIEGLGTLLSNHIPNYRNLITSYKSMS